MGVGAASIGGDLSFWDGEPGPTLRSLWGVPALELHDVVTSTQERARELASTGAPPGTLVLAEAQSEGRGRGSNRWRSDRGAGVWMSWLAPSEGSDARRSASPSLHAGVACAEAIEEVAPECEVGVKWPNDLEIEGRKCGGILCQSSGGGLVVGVGINVRPLAPEARAELPGAISLEEASGRRISRTELVRAVVDRLRVRLGPGSAAADGAEFASAWNRRDVLRGRTIRVSSGTHEIEGIAEGIDEQGALLVAGTDGVVHPVAAGTVRVVGRRSDEAGGQSETRENGEEAGR